MSLPDYRGNSRRWEPHGDHCGLPVVTTLWLWEGHACSVGCHSPASVRPHCSLQPARLVLRAPGARAPLREPPACGCGTGWSSPGCPPNPESVFPEAAAAFALPGRRAHSRRPTSEPLQGRGRRASGKTRLPQARPPGGRSSRLLLRAPESFLHSRGLRHSIPREPPQVGTIVNPCFSGEAMS